MRNCSANVLARRRSAHGFHCIQVWRTARSQWHAHADRIPLAQGRHQRIEHLGRDIDLPAFCAGLPIRLLGCALVDQVGFQHASRLRRRFEHAVHEDLGVAHGDAGAGFGAPWSNCRTTVRNPATTLPGSRAASASTTGAKCARAVSLPCFCNATKGSMVSADAAASRKLVTPCLRMASSAAAAAATCCSGRGGGKVENTRLRASSSRMPVGSCCASWAMLPPAGLASGRRHRLFSARAN